MFASSGNAIANDLTFNGIPVPTNLAGGLWYIPVAGTTVAHVNTLSLDTGLLNAIWIAQVGLAGTQNITVDSGFSVTGNTAIVSTAFTDTINITNNGALISTVLDGIYAQNLISGDITVAGAGTYDATRNGMWLLTPSGDVNAGTAAIPLGAIDAGLNGVVINNPAGAINVYASSIDAALGYGVWTLGGTGDQTISTTGAVNAPLLSGIFANSTDGKITATGNGTSVVTGNVYGVSVNTIGGAASVNDFASVTGGTAVSAITITGDISVNGIGDITGDLLDGVNAFSAGGNIGIGDVKAIGAVEGARNGIWAATTGAGTVDIASTKDVTGTVNYGILATAIDGTITVDVNNVTGGTFGIQASNTAGGANITAAGTTTSGLTGIYGTSTTGDINVAGKGTGVVNAGDEGVTLATTSGNVSVKDFVSVTAADTALWLLPATGNITIADIGTLTGKLGDGVIATTVGGDISIQGAGTVGGINGGGRDGIFANAVGGNINIGDVKANGAITGFDEGIEAYTLGTGNVTIKTAADITGTALGWGIFTNTVDGNVAIGVDAGTVKSNNVTGINAQALGTGNVGVDVAAGATVTGEIFGLSTGTSSGISTINNAGLLTNNDDFGAAIDPGKMAYWAVSGTNIINNTGDIVGGITTAGIATTLNNEAGGMWTPSLVNVAVALTNDINNAGLINIREGATIGLTAAGTAVTNLSGGVIDMRYGGSGAAVNAKDSLNVFNFSPKAGSTVKFDVDFTQANGAGTEALANDHSSNGQGTADTIVVYGVATPQGVSIVDMSLVGKAKTGTSGSIALVNAVPGGLRDPGKGGFATMVASDNYVMASDPSTGAVVYRLVEDKNGGVYLQWAPNVSAASLGGFGGAVGAGGAGGASAGAALAAGSAGFAGGGGFGAGPGGGGAAGEVSDMASADASSSNTTTTCSGDQYTRAWAQGEASRSNFDDGDGRNNSFSGGVEANFSQKLTNNCNLWALGAFAFTGNSNANWSTGSVDSDNTGVGGYVRASNSMGFYATLLGSVSWSDADLANRIYESTASKDGTNVAGVASVGYVTGIAANTSVDFRAYVAYGDADGDGFTDSQGITVSGSSDQLVTVGGLVGLYTALSPTARGFVRGGVKWSELDSSITAFGITQTGTVDETSGSVEAGFDLKSSENVTLGASGFGEFSESTDSYGGRAHVGVKF